MYTLVERSDVKTSRPVLERAGWRCERCPSTSSLRVVAYRGAVLALCDACRVRGAWMKHTRASS